MALGTGINHVDEVMLIDAAAGPQLSAKGETSLCSCICPLEFTGISLCLKYFFVFCESQASRPSVPVFSHDQQLIKPTGSVSWQELFLYKTFI